MKRTKNTLSSNYFDAPEELSLSIRLDLIANRVKPDNRVELRKKRKPTECLVCNRGRSMSGRIGQTESQGLCADLQSPSLWGIRSAKVVEKHRLLNIWHESMVLGSV